MSIQKRRIDKGWSQEHLASVAGISIRTIQRIEAGNKPGLESLNCLAAVFETDVKTLLQETSMPHRSETHPTPTPSLEGPTADDLTAIEYGKNVLAFRMNFYAMLLTLPILLWLNLDLTPDYLWIKWVAAFWGLSLILHAMVMKQLFGQVNIFFKTAHLNNS